MHRLIARVAVASLVLAAIVVMPARGKTAPDGPGCALLLPRDYPPISDADRALKEVPGFPGVPAAWLLRACTDEWGDLLAKYQFQRQQRRLKILTPAGASAFGTMNIPLSRDFHVITVKARTIRPDGSIVNASSGVHDVSDPDRTLRVIFPAVEPGAILDLYFEGSQGTFRLGEWQVQASLPVLRSTYVLDPPKELIFRAGVQNLPESASVPSACTSAAGPVYAWDFRDVAPHDDVPWSPPESTFIQKLVIVMASLALGPSRVSFASSWADYSAFSLSAEWVPWFQRCHGRTDALARAAVNGVEGPRARVEAIRRTFDAAVSVTEGMALETNCADRVLEAKTGSLAEAVGVHVRALREVDIDASPAVYASWPNGPIPEGSPIPMLFDRHLVRVALPDGALLWYEPGDGGPIDRPPWLAVGVLALPLRAGVKAPDQLPPATANDSRVSVQLDATVSDTGDAEGKLVVTHVGIAAHRMRAAMAKMTEEERSAHVTRVLGFDEESVVLSHIVVSMDPSPAGEVRVSANAGLPGAALRAGNRLILRPVPTALATNLVQWPDAKRTRAIWMGMPGVRDARVTWTLPEGITDVTMPQDHSRAAGAAGGSSLAYAMSEDGRQLTVTRTRRIESSMFTAQSWDGLRAWHVALAAAEEQPLTGTLP